MYSSIAFLCWYFDIKLHAYYIKGMGSSPFSEESNSIRNSPKAEAVDPKLPQEIDMGLRFGPNEEVWHDKTQKIGPPAEPTAASGPGPYFPGPLQVWLCSSTTHVWYHQSWSLILDFVLYVYNSGHWNLCCLYFGVISSLCILM